MSEIWKNDIFVVIGSVRKTGGGENTDRSRDLDFGFQRKLKSVYLGPMHGHSS